MSTDYHKDAIVSGVVMGGVAAYNYYEATGDSAHTVQAGIRGAMIGYFGYLALVWHLLVSACLPFVVYLWAMIPIWEANQNNAHNAVWNADMPRDYWLEITPITPGMRFQQVVMLSLVGLHLLTTVWAMKRWGLAALARAYDELTARPYQDFPRPERKFEARVRHLPSFTLLVNAVAVPWIVALGGGLAVSVILWEPQFFYGILSTIVLALGAYVIARMLYGRYCPELYQPYIFPAPITRHQRQQIKLARRSPNAAPLWMSQTLKWGGGAWLACGIVSFIIIVGYSLWNPYAT